MTTIYGLKAGILLLFCAVGFFSYLSFALPDFLGQRQWGSVKLKNIAHRGASGDLPEETIAAYELAVLFNASAIECDMVVTKDEVLICRHTPNLEEGGNFDNLPEFSDYRKAYVLDPGVNATQTTGIFSVDLTLEQIKKIPAVQISPIRTHAYDSKFFIPTVQEVMDVVRKVNTWKAQVYTVINGCRWQCPFSAELKKMCCVVFLCTRFFNRRNVVNFPGAMNNEAEFFEEYSVNTFGNDLEKARNLMKKCIKNRTCFTSTDFKDNFTKKVRNFVLPHEVFHYFAPENLHKYGLLRYRYLVADFLMMTHMEIDMLITQCANKAESSLFNRVKRVEVPDIFEGRRSDAYESSVRHGALPVLNSLELNASDERVKVENFPAGKTAGEVIEMNVVKKSENSIQKEDASSKYPDVAKKDQGELTKVYPEQVGTSHQSGGLVSNVEDTQADSLELLVTALKFASKVAQAVKDDVNVFEEWISVYGYPLEVILETKHPFWHNKHVSRTMSSLVVEMGNRNTLIKTLGLITIESFDVISISDLFGKGFNIMQLSDLVTNYSIIEWDEPKNSCKNCWKFSFSPVYFSLVRYAAGFELFGEENRTCYEFMKLYGVAYEVDMEGNSLRLVPVCPTVTRLIADSIGPNKLLFEENLNFDYFTHFRYMRIYPYTFADDKLPAAYLTPIEEYKYFSTRSVAGFFTDFPRTLDEYIRFEETHL